MCRTGGRRCPGEHDPAKVAARNARRRAKYAADKVGEAKVISKPKQASSALKKTNTSSSVETFSKVEAGVRGLGIVKTPTSGVKKDAFFQQETISGVLDYTKLDENSYAEFGFENSSGKGWALKTSDTQQVENRSLEEVKKLSMAQKIALTQFARDRVYQWVNQVAYDPSLLEQGIPYRNIMGLKHREVAKIYDDPLADPHDAEYLDNDGFTIEMLKRTTDELDAALQRGPKRQRIVYRGVRDESIFAETGGVDVGEWVKENRSIGTEVSFAGYTSTTINRAVANDFATDPDAPALVYEILTPEGVAISSVSDMPGEQEVLLPRNQRYMVVGTHEALGTEGKFGGTKRTLRPDKTVHVVQMVAINSKGEVLDGSNSDPIEPLVSDEAIRHSRDRFPVAIMEASRAESFHEVKLSSPRYRNYTLRGENTANDPEFLAMWEQETRDSAADRMATVGMEKDIPLLDTIEWSDVGFSQTLLF